MSNNKKVFKLKNTIKFNSATIVFGIILFYILARLFVFSNKEPITVYEVNKSTINNNIILSGIAIRNETLISSTKSGYVNYYVRDGEKANKLATVCTIDETGKTVDYLQEAQVDGNLFSDKDYSNIRNTISLYKTNYNDIEFYNTYIFKNNIENKVLETANEILMQQLSISSDLSTFSSITTPESGAITYYSDGFETLSIDNISKEIFDKTNYNKISLKSGEIINSNNPVFKVISSEEWSIIAPITDEQIQSFSDSNSISFVLNNSSYKIRANYEILNGLDGKYINIKLKKYLSNFIDERFLTIEILMDDVEGLKVPNSAIINKDVYKIPIEFYYSLGDDKSKYFYSQFTSDDGSLITERNDVYICFIDEGFCYVDTNNFDEADVLVDLSGTKTLTMITCEKTSKKAVYKANTGTAKIKYIDIIKEGDEFSVISPKGQIQIYDKIILDSTKVKENQIIY